MPRITANYQAALKNPIIDWNKPISETETEVVKVFNPAIDPGFFSIEFDDFGTRGVKPHITTPRMRLEGIGCSDDDDTNREVKEFITSLYLDDDTMKDYADVITWAHERRTSAGATRYDTFDKRWKAGQLHSGLICYNNEEKPVGIFNIGTSVDHNGVMQKGVAEFAGITHATYQKNLYASEASMLLFFYPEAVREKGCCIPGDNNTLATSITATAKVGSGSDKIMDNLRLTKIATVEKYGAPRNVYQDTLDDLKQVVENTKLRNKI